jgi:sugar O-acyltransferase (sialic acid O-acetyltransferase NeuD family)
MKDIIVIGTALFAEVVRDYFHEYTDNRVRAFACHEKYKSQDMFGGLPVVTIEELDHRYPPGEVELFVAIGYRKMNQLRQATYEELKVRGYSFASFIAPNVKTWSSNHFGENVFIFENNVIQPHVKIGNNTILWSGNHIGHHSSIGNHCFISSHVVVSGSCKIGDNSFLGVNSTLHDNLSIGPENLIGAGAVIARDTREREVFVPNGTKAFPKSSDQLEF